VNAKEKQKRQKGQIGSKKVFFASFALLAFFASSLPSL
jgi:hypothetical protein